MWKGFINFSSDTRQANKAIYAQGKQSKAINEWLIETDLFSQADVGRKIACLVQERITLISDRSGNKGSDWIGF